MNVLAEALDAASGSVSPHDRLGMSRRQFLHVTSVAVGAGFLGLSVSSCDQVIAALIERIKNRPVRRDISTLALDDPIIESYKTAVQAMRALPASDRRNWNRQAQIHDDVCRHASWLFFPWHRAYLMYFERICQKLSGNPSFGLPYWDWTANPRIPAHFWVAGSPLLHSPRNATASTNMPADSVGPAVVNPMLDEPNFLVFAGPAVPLDSTAQFGPGYGVVEQTPHNDVHGTIGGTMATFLSPLDPVFWMHHNRCEQLWVEWNVDRGHPNTNDAAWVNTKFVNDFCDEEGADVEVTVAALTLAPLLSYRFDSQGA